jgi:L-asparagine transporter-like permease
MGIVVVAGTCSAVNVLLIAVSRMIAGMAVQGFLPSFFGFARDRAPIPLIILATGIAAMLALGMAGAPALEVYMRAGLLFWLLNYAVVNLSVLIMGRRMHDRSTLLQIPGYPATIIISILAFLGGFAGLLWSDNESVLLLKFMLSILVVVSLLSLVWIVLGREKSPADPRMT